MAAKKLPTTIYMEPELKELAIKQAEDEYIPFTAWCRNLIRKELRRVKKL